MRKCESGTGCIPLPRAIGLGTDVADASRRRQCVEDADIPDALHKKCLEVGWHDHVGSLTNPRRRKLSRNNHWSCEKRMAMVDVSTGAMRLRTSGSKKALDAIVSR